MGDLGSFAQLLGGLAGGSGASSSLFGAGAAGGLASLGFGPLAAITAIPAAAQIVGQTMAGNQQARERVAAENMQRWAARREAGSQFVMPEFDVARQGFGLTRGTEFKSRSPDYASLAARDLQSKMSQTGKNPFERALAGRFMGVA